MVAAERGQARSSTPDEVASLALQRWIEAGNDADLPAGRDGCSMFDA